MTFEETALMLYARQFNKEIVTVAYTPIDGKQEQKGGDK